VPHPDDQAAGLRSLFDMAEPDWAGRNIDYESRRASWHRDRGRSVRGHHRDVRASRQAVLAQRQVPQGALTEEVTPGALNARYDIPTIRFDRKEARGLFLTSIVVAAWVSYHLGWQSLALLACAAPGAAFRAVNYVLSWFDKPVTATAEENLLGFPGNSMRGTSVTHHEFAHAIMNLGFSDTERAAWTRIYRNGAGGKVFKDCGSEGRFAMGNPEEYWAVLSTAYFSRNWSDLNTPETIKSHDSAAYQFIESIYGLPAR